MVYIHIGIYIIIYDYCTVRCTMLDLDLSAIVEYSVSVMIELNIY